MGNALTAPAAAIALLAAAVGQVPTTNPVVPSSESVARGKNTYLRHCQDCHGPEGHGTEVFGAVRLPNGNTLIAGGNNNRVIEVDPAGKVVWTLDQKELPGITLAWVTTLHALPNGNLIVGNCHAGPDNPQLFEVTRDKKLVWVHRDASKPGIHHFQVLDTNGKALVGRPLR